MCKVVAIYILLFMSGVSLAAIHDPTRPPGVAVSVGILGSNVAIKAIILRHDKKEVLIGDRYLTIGDKIGGSKIVDISKNAIVLQNGGSVVTISLFRPVNKQSKISSGDKS